MQSAALQPATRPSSGATNFAAILASATDPPWNNDGLAEDVASISYERALRTHSRSYSGTAGKEAVPDPEPAAQSDPAPDGKRLKTASITLRLSEPECALVRQRAVEAGLTVSAYLRSCALEVESLRTQVKETLAQLQNNPAPPRDNSLVEPAHRSTILARAWQWIRQRETSVLDS